MTETINEVLDARGDMERAASDGAANARWDIGHCGDDITEQEYEVSQQGGTHRCHPSQKGCGCPQYRSFRMVARNATAQIRERLAGGDGSDSTYDYQREQYPEHCDADGPAPSSDECRAYARGYCEGYLKVAASRLRDTADMMIRVRWYERRERIRMAHAPTPACMANETACDPCAHGEPCALVSAALCYCDICITDNPRPDAEAHMFSEEN